MIKLISDKENLPLLKIGLIADPQYADIESFGLRYYTEAADKIKEALETFQQNKVDFIINLGDMIDRHYVSGDKIFKYYKKLKIPYYNILGNHDFEIEDKYKKDILKRYKMPDYYYDFTVKDFRFIMLDGSELGAYASFIHPDLAEEGFALRESARGKINDKPWNGGISKKQQAWLREVLDNTKIRNQKALIFCHFPVLPDTIDLTLWNNDEIIKLLEEYSNIITYYAGHYHEGGYTYKSGIHFIIQKAMCDTHKNAFAIMDIFPKQINIKGFGNIEDASYQISE